MSAVGVIEKFGGIAANIPPGRLACVGGDIDRTVYADLFAVIGTTWGAGDGVTTFTIPDFRGRTPIGVGTGSGLTPRTLGSEGGTEKHTLTVPQLPEHKHSLIARDTGGLESDVENNVLANQGSAFYAQNTGVDDVNWGEMEATGSNQPHENMQPFAVVEFVIVYQVTTAGDDGRKLTQLPQVPFVSDSDIAYVVIGGVSYQATIGEMNSLSLPKTEPDALTDGLSIDWDVNNEPEQQKTLDSSNTATTIDIQNIPNGAAGYLTISPQSDAVFNYTFTSTDLTVTVGGEGSNVLPIDNDTVGNRFKITIERTGSFLDITFNPRTY